MNRRSLAQGIEFSKVWQTIKVDWVRQMSYKANFIFMVIGPVFVFFFVKYNLWEAIFRSRNNIQVGGYSFQSMLQYQIWVLVVVLLGQTYNGMRLAMDIRYGKISTYLIYPFDFWQFHFSNFLSFQLLQWLVSILILIVAVSYHWLDISSYIHLFEGMFICMLVGFFTFIIQFFVAAMAFWLEETWVIRVILMQIGNFLSGSLFPIDIFPLWIQKFVIWTPFPYLTYYPVKVFMGTSDKSVLHISFVLLIWILITLIGLRTVWLRGMRNYTAAGI